MEKIKVEIKNCYGINNLENEFDFSSDKSAQVIYAPNGVMKTSFANVFDDYSKGIESKDLIYPMNESIRIIKDNFGNNIIPESIFVIRPYEKTYKSNKMSTLLVKEELRKQYDKIHEKIESKKEKLVQALKPATGLRNNIEQTLCESFNVDSNRLLQVLVNLEESVNSDSESRYSYIIFNKIFDEKVINFLETGDFKNQIKEYIEKYDELISKSQFLNKGFNHYHATIVHKNLNENGFFKADHSINLSVNGEKQEITDQKEFLKLIKGAKEEILNDVTLKEKRAKSALVSLILLP